MATDLYKELTASEDITMEKILNFLLKSDKDLPLKSHIENPVALATLSVLAEYLEKKELKKSANILKIFIRVFLEYMVSYKRLGRKEIIEAFKSRIEKEEREKLQRLLGST